MSFSPSQHSQTAPPFSKLRLSSHKLSLNPHKLRLSLYKLSLSLEISAAPKSQFCKKKVRRAHPLRMPFLLSSSLLFSLLL